MPSLLFPGATRSQRFKDRCLWREESFLLHLLRRALNPPLSLQQSLKDWFSIAQFLKESPRQRRSQLDLLFNSKGPYLSA